MNKELYDLCLTGIMVTLFFLPALIAIARGHLNATPIFLTNVTVIGWVIALIWSFTNPPPPPQPRRMLGLKIVLALTMILTTLYFWGSTHGPSGRVATAPKKQQAPVATTAPRTGVPVPADEVLGK